MIIIASILTMYITSSRIDEFILIASNLIYYQITRVAVPRAKRDIAPILRIVNS